MPTKKDRFRRCAACLCMAGVLAGASACSSSLRGGVEPIEHGSQLAIFDGQSGLSMTWAGLVAACANADAVLIGEQHGHPQGLAAAADLFDAILARKPNSAALALEFMERDDQVAIDDYLGGLIDRDAFEQAIGASATSSPPEHQRMLEAARAAGRPVVAANAPRRYVRLARQGFDALDALTDEQRRLFEVPAALTGGGYRDRFFEIMGGMGASHGEADAAPPTAMIESFYRSQNVWDATMASTVSGMIRGGSAPVVLVVGQFHTDFEGGLTERLRTLRPNAKVMTLSMQDTSAPTLRDEDRGRANVVMHVGSVPGAGG